MPTFYHSGSLGDQIYSLPTFIKLGGGTFVSGMPWAAYKAMSSLLRVQPAVKTLHHVSEAHLPVGFTDLSSFRNHPLFTRMHIADLHAEQQEVRIDKTLRWLHVEDSNPAWRRIHMVRPYAIVAVTSRYRDRFFWWDREVVRLFQATGKVYFIGHYNEYKEFIGRLGYRAASMVEFKQTDDLLTVARIVKDAELFSGNQSVALAIRQGLALPWRFEQSPNHRDTEQGTGKETILNPWTRRLHLATVCMKRMLFDNQYTRHQI